MAGESRDLFGWTGAKIERSYKVLEVAAVGGFGVVYKAMHPVFGEPVAVKCLRMRPGLSPQERQDFIVSFIKEARILYRLSREADAVVQPLHVGADTSPSGAFTPFLVMEWLHGETLGDDLRRRGEQGLEPWRISEALPLLAPVFEALAIAHAGGVIHRDLKPENLFLRHGHRAKGLKLLDFGIAKVMSHSAASTDVLPAFTLRYVAPEQLDRRVGPTRPWTDVYSMALVLLEMFTGRPGYLGRTKGELAAEALDRDSRPSPRARGVDLGDDFEDFFRCALALDPASRFHSAEAMFEALRTVWAAGDGPHPARIASQGVYEARTVLTED